eukprot:g1673.t1
MGRSSKKGGSDAIKRVPLFRVSTQESLDSPIDRRSDFYRQKAIESGPVSPRLFTLPTILTILRILLVPVLVVLWFNPWKWAPFLGAQVFMFASLTDCLDGFLARKLNLTTAFGAFLDPVADKLMVSAALILLSIDPPQPMSSTAIAIPVIVIIGREITMSALREWAASASAEAHKAVKVNSLGKWKTAFQFLSLAMLLSCRKPETLLTLINMQEKICYVELVAIGSWICLWISAFLAVLSLSRYMINIWSHFKVPVAKCD